MQKKKKILCFVPFIFGVAISDHLIHKIRHKIYTGCPFYYNSTISLTRFEITAYTAWVIGGVVLGVLPKDPTVAARWWWGSNPDPFISNPEP